ncbi:hypothetical protein FA13DRAFT_1781116 [Coprinellus micaceus]|uniref:Uncharacterized protein n=1 Tax=Coprinellus micaceus TaxID=71717 RepID=A0A4Y7SB95_COPMI|nr:hypothetical protein FA13DRAFT_1781116 [Coprinellus micaceus]
MRFAPRNCSSSGSRHSSLPAGTTQTGPSRARAPFGICMLRAVSLSTSAVPPRQRRNGWLIKEPMGIEPLAEIRTHFTAKAMKAPIQLGAARNTTCATQGQKATTPSRKYELDFVAGSGIDPRRLESARGGHTPIKTIAK